MTSLMFYIHLLFNKLPKLSVALADGVIFQHIFFYLKFTWFLFSRKSWKRGEGMSFSFFFNDLEFSLKLHHPVDISSLVELYVDKEYEHEPLHDPRIIIDLGANYGDSTLYFHALYPNAHIYAIEPTPNSFNYLKKNVENINCITPVNALVSNKTKMVDFFLNDDGSLGNSMIQRSDNIKSIKVQSFTLEDLYKELSINHVDMLKFDIEGAEGMLFTHTSPEEISDTYIGEIHEDLMSISKEGFLNQFKKFTVQLKPLKNPDRSIIFASKVKK